VVRVQEDGLTELVTDARHERRDLPHPQEVALTFGDADDDGDALLPARLGDGSQRNELGYVEVPQRHTPALGVLERSSQRDHRVAPHSSSSIRSSTVITSRSVHGTSPAVSLRT